MLALSQRRPASLRARRALLSSRRGVRLLGWRAEGAHPVGHLLHADRRLRPGAGRAAAAAGGAVPSQEQLRGDNGRVFAGPPPSQVTERRKGGREEGQRCGGR